MFRKVSRAFLRRLAAEIEAIKQDDAVIAFEKAEAERAQKSAEHVKSRDFVIQQRGKLDFPGGKLLLVGPPTQNRQQIAERISEQYGLQPLFLSQRCPEPERIASLVDSVDLLVIDADAIGEAGEVVDYFLALRARIPELPIIMCTHRVLISDYSPERKMLCDVTLKAPSSRVSIDLAVTSALENHAYYLRSLKETGLVR